MTEASPVESSPLTRRRLLGLLLVAAQAPLGSTMIATVLPELALDVETDPALLTHLLASSYLLVGIILQSPGGRLGDIFGHVRIFSVGQTLIVLGALVGTLAQDAVLLTAARVLMAAGGAFAVPAVIALLRLHVPPERRARVFGQIGAVMGFAAALGPTLGGVLLEWFDWRAIFFVSLPLVLLAAVLQLGLRGAVRARSRHFAVRDTMRELARFDWSGTALQAAAIAAVVVGATLAQQPLWAGAWFAAGGLLFALFVVVELRRNQPVVDPRLFRLKSYTAGSLLIGFQNLAMYGLLFQMPHIYKQLHDVTPTALGAVLFAMMGGMVVGAPLGGRLADRFGTRWIAMIGTILTVVGVALLVDVEALQTPLDALAGLVLVGFGIGLAGAPAQAAAMSAVPAERSGMAAGLMTTMRYLGGMVGMSIFGILLAGEAITEPAGHRTLMYLYVASFAVSVALTWLLPRKGYTASKPEQSQAGS